VGLNLTRRHPQHLEEFNMQNKPVLYPARVVVPTLLPVALIASALVLGGCAGTPAAPASQAPKPMATTEATVTQPSAAARELFVVLPEDERIYAFGDTKNYFQYLEHAEVALTRTRIGDGPGGRTLVFGITNDDVKANAPSVAERVLDKKLPAAPDFYGEVFKDGRFYVFHTLKDMNDFIEHGEVALAFTDIGAGPNGASIVWVMNKESMAKGRPTATMERFKAIRVASK
jgi:hypothetical protein